MSKIIEQGQSFLDKVVELTGSFENALEMSIHNNISITSPLSIGEIIEVKTITNKHVVSFFNKYNTPATALTTEEIQTIENPGIGLMIVQNTFKIG